MSSRYHRRQAQYRRIGEESGYLDEPGGGEEDGEGARRLSRDLEEGFRDHSDDESEEGDDRLRSGEGR